MPKKFLLLNILFLLTVACSFHETKELSSFTPTAKEDTTPTKNKENVAHELKEKDRVNLPTNPGIAAGSLPFYEPVNYPVLNIPILGGGSGGGSILHRPKCGNNLVEGNEQCDDGNKRSYDGCSFNCKTEVLLSVARSDDQLRVINPENGETLCQRSIILPEVSLNGANGLAVDPNTGVLYGIIKEAGNVRDLVTIDPLTAQASFIGIPSISGIAGIAFDSSSRLFAVTGDGGTPPETLFTLSTIDASSTFFMTLGNGSDGESIAYDTKDGFLYHTSGRFSGIFTFEKINLDTQNIVAIYEDTTSEEISALTYLGADDSFLAANIDEELYRITSDGIITFLGEMDHVAKGLAFVPQAFSCRLN